MLDKIIIRGAREHNLKSINLDLPKNKFIVFTGVSGSGKSTLAFDTIFAEGQRRYLESLSAYARQFLGQMEKPDVDHIEGLSPAISISQKSASHNPRSTVGTVTEIHDYLRLIYAKIGIPHCPVCSREISKMSTDEIVERMFDVGEDKEIEILSPAIRDRKGEYATLLFDLYKRGFSGAYVDGKKYELDPKIKIKLERYKKHSIDVIVDELKANDGNLTRIFESVEKALKLSGGFVKLREKSVKSKTKKDYVFNQNISCPVHEEVSFPELEPRLFSFNSPYGACPSCEGLGVKKEIDPNLVAPDRNKTIAEGAIMPWSYKRNNYQGTILRAVTNFYHIPDNVRLRDLSEEDLKIIIEGEEIPDDIPVAFHTKSGRTWKFNVNWKGIVGFLQDRYFKTESEAVREDIEKYMSNTPCSFCKGTRYKKEVLFVKIGGKNIAEVSNLSIAEALDYFNNLSLNEREKAIAQRILEEVKNRLSFLVGVGLDYLTLGRSASSLAGGETQRIRLASQIGSKLTGVLYVLDEPSIGLHSRDNEKLLNTLEFLRDLGNTLIVIEHDEETMKRSDFLVDIGPGAGKLGGEIVAQGTPEELIKSENSLTAKYLRGDLEIPIPKSRRPVKNKKSIIVRGAGEHNLKNISVEFPLKVLTCVTGVSGSGKSTLVEEILYRALSAKIMRSIQNPGRHKEIVGEQNVDKVILIDQSPIGRTPRSNPATYTGLFTPIRDLFEKTSEARVRGYSASRFSFNLSGGRCDNCKGEGFLKVEMQFMPDLYLPCDVCKGKRYNSETLKVLYKGKNISDVLKMTVSEAEDFFRNLPEVHGKLKVLEEVGLGYIQLGQSATTLSGGEAQRIKLASELSRRGTGNTIYILDEPTTGLHFDDINKLLHILNRLVDAGNTVIVIEHNMDVIKTADWIIDLGPEGGERGGKVIVTGPPEEVAKYAKESYTAKFLKKALKK